MADEALAVAAEVPTAEPSAVEQNSTPESVATAGQAPEDSTKPAKADKTFTQGDVDEIVRKRLAKEQRKIERYAAAEAELRILKESQARTQEPAQQSRRDKPRPDQFQDYESFAEALSEWKVEQKLGELSEAAQQQRIAEARQAEQERVKAKFAEAASKYEDFDEVVRNPDLAISGHMANALGASPVAAEIAYHLGNNPNEARRISSLSPIEQVREIFLIEAKLTAKAPPAPTKAPDPIEPVGNQAKVQKNPGEMTNAEYAKWRKRGRS